MRGKTYLIAVALLLAAYLVCTGEWMTLACAGMGITLVSVSQLTTQANDKRRECGTLQAKLHTLWEEDQKLSKEIAELQLKQDPTDADQKRIAEIQARREAIDKEYGETELSIEKITEEISALDKQIERGNRLNTREAALAAAQPRTVDAQTAGTSRIQYVEPDKKTRINDLGCIIRCVAAAGGQYRQAPVIAREIGNERVALAMEATSFTGGGFLIPENYVPDLIELLTAQTVIRRMGISTPPLVNGTLTLPRLLTGATASYIGEGQNIPKSEGTGGQLKLTAKKLVAAGAGEQRLAAVEQSGSRQHRAGGPGACDGCGRGRGLHS